MEFAQRRKTENCHNIATGSLKQVSIDGEPHSRASFSFAMNGSLGCHYDSTTSISKLLGSTTSPGAVQAHRVRKLRAFSRVIRFVRVR